MRELDVREVAQGPGTGRERRGPRRSAGAVRCGGARSGGARSAGARSAGVTRADVGGAGARRAGAGPVPVAGAAPRSIGFPVRRSIGSLAGQACPAGAAPFPAALLPAAPFPAVRPVVVRAVPAVGGARRAAGRPGSTGPAIVPPRTVRPATRRCVAPARRRSPRLRVRSAGERFLIGVATVACAATAVVVLGLLGDAAAGWNSGPVEPVGTGAVVSGTAGR